METTSSDCRINFGIHASSASADTMNLPSVVRHNFYMEGAVELSQENVYRFEVLHECIRSVLGHLIVASRIRSPSEGKRHHDGLLALLLFEQYNACNRSCSQI